MSGSVYTRYWLFRLYIYIYAYWWLFGSMLSESMYTLLAIWFYVYKLLAIQVFCIHIGGWLLSSMQTLLSIMFYTFMHCWLSGSMLYTLLICRFYVCILMAIHWWLCGSMYILVAMWFYVYIGAIWFYIHVCGYLVLCIPVYWWLSGSMYILVAIWFYVHIGGFLVLCIHL